MSDPQYTPQGNPERLTPSADTYPAAAAFPQGQPEFDPSYVGATAAQTADDPRMPVEHEDGSFGAPSGEDDTFRAVVRHNLRWLLAEIDHTRQGRTAQEREKLNP
jgi:hypothetical protein